MQNQKMNQAETNAMLNEILLQPSNEMISNRFLATADESAVCGASCSGQCHGIV
jgi:hypothetical protein